MKLICAREVETKYVREQNELRDHKGTRDGKH